MENMFDDNDLDPNYAKKIETQVISRTRKGTSSTADYETMYKEFQQDLEGFLDTIPKGISATSPLKLDVEGTDDFFIIYSEGCKSCFC